MKQYLDLLRIIRETGVYKQDRTGTGTYSIFAHQMRFDLSDGQFPLVTTKKTHLKSIIHELLWFLQGSTNIRYLKENGVKIWDQWVKPETAEYRGLDLKERSEMVSKKGEETLEKWVDHIREVRGDFLEGMSDLNDEILEKHHQFLDTLNIPRQVLIAGELGPVYGSQWRDWPVAQQSIVDALIELACLGSPHGKWGNSDGNLIAQHALLNIPGIRQHKKAYMSSGYIYADWVIKTPDCDPDQIGIKGGIDQIAKLVDQLKYNPDSRRLIVSAWNPAEVDQMALPPCHCLFQFYTAPLSFEERQELAKKKGFVVGEDPQGGIVNATLVLNELGVPERRLSCQLYQRKSNCALIA